MAETLAIVNPTSGNGAGARTWGRLLANVPAGKKWDCAITERPGHARALASAAAGHYERVVAIGGDGTVSEIAGGLVNSATCLAIVPAGTGNDTARNLGIPRSAVAAARLAATGGTRSIDVGEVQTRTASTCFLNVAGFGFDAEAAWRVNRFPKLISGTLPYVAGVLRTLAGYRAPLVELDLDGKSVTARIFLIAVANCPSYGGGMRIAPDARPDDGLLDVCIVNDLSRLEVLRMLPSLYSGGHVRHPAVSMVRCRSLSADAPARVLCQADGELVGALPSRFALRPGALRFVTGPNWRRSS